MLKEIYISKDKRIKVYKTGIKIYSVSKLSKEKSKWFGIPHYELIKTYKNEAAAVKYAKKLSGEYHE